MIVRVPILVVHGYYEFDSSEDTLPKAVQQIKDQRAAYCGQHVSNVKLNYDAAYDQDHPPQKNQAEDIKA